MRITRASSSVASRRVEGAGEGRKGGKGLGGSSKPLVVVVSFFSVRLSMRLWWDGWVGG